MKVQLKSPVFEVSEEDFDELKKWDCRGVDCRSCPYRFIIGSKKCGILEFKRVGYTLEAAELEKESQELRVKLKKGLDLLRELNGMSAYGVLDHLHKISRFIKESEGVE